MINDFYRKEIEPMLPDTILDFHTHLWKRDQWINTRVGLSPSAGYMVTEPEYSDASLMEDGHSCFYNKQYNAVCFGQPSPVVDTDRTNEYISSAAKSNPRIFPLMVTGGGLLPPSVLEDRLISGGFLGYKVYLPWIGNDYGKVRVEDMLTPDEAEVGAKMRVPTLEGDVELYVPASTASGRIR